MAGGVNHRTIRNERALVGKSKNKSNYLYEEKTKIFVPRETFALTRVISS